MVITIFRAFIWKIRDLNSFNDTTKHKTNTDNKISNLQPVDDPEEVGNDVTEIDDEISVALSFTGRSPPFNSRQGDSRQKPQQKQCKYCRYTTNKPEGVLVTELLKVIDDGEVAHDEDRRDVVDSVIMMGHHKKYEHVNDKVAGLVGPVDVEGFETMGWNPSLERKCTANPL